MPKFNTQKLKNFAGHILEPIALGVLALLFIIPALTVQNLTPITKKLKDLKVLGVATQSDLRVDLVGGKHEVFTSENLSKVSAENYTYYTTINRESMGSSSKPILKIANNSTEVKTITFYGQTDSSIRSFIKIIVDDESYNIQDAQGQTYTQKIQIASGQTLTIGLYVESPNDVNFSSDFEMQVKVEKDL